MENFPPLLRPLVKDARRKAIPKDQIILYEGDVASDMMIIKSGIIKVHDIDEQGNEKILHLLKRPGIIPFAFFSGGEDPMRWFYTALTDCELYIVPRVKVLSDLRVDSALALHLMNWFSNEMHEILTRLSSLSKTNARDKLIAALKFLAVCHSVERNAGWWRVAFPVSHQVLADMVGITRESTALAMKELQGDGLVRNPRLTVLEINLSKLPD
jgi:CRP-like cAMP-binding protein